MDSRALVMTVRNLRHGDARRNVQGITRRGGRDTPLGVVPLVLSSSTLSWVTRRPIRLALIDDYDVVVMGVARMFDKYQDRVVVVELDTNVSPAHHVDIALYDSFAQPEADRSELPELVASPRCDKVVVYTWNFHPTLVDAAYAAGASGYLSKTLPASDLVDALERIHDGERVTSEAPGKHQVSVGQDWPGRSEGLSEREAEIVALITQGKSNADVAELAFLSANSVKSYIRSAYRKIGASNRVEAVLWGVANGFLPDHHRIDGWRVQD